MIIKVETYYEVTAKAGTKIPESIKTILSDKVRKEFPTKVTLEETFWKGELLTAKLLTNEEILERIRTAK